MTASASVLRAPFPWYGGKSRVADRVWGLQRLTAWCETNGDRSDTRIVLCGYEGDWEPSPGWRTIAYTGKGTSSENRTRERLWASASCVGEMSLFETAA